MVTANRSVSFKELHHLITSVGQQQPDGALATALAFNDISSIVFLKTLTKLEIETMESGDDTKPLKLGLRGLLRGLQAFVYHLDNTNPDIDYFTLTHEHYNKFLYQHYRPHLPYTPPSTVCNHTSYSRTPAEEFRRTLEISKSHYHVLKTDKEWDDWNFSTIATARVHGCENILDPKYKPMTQDDKDLFEEQQKFMYSVFVDKLQTDIGKYYVRHYEKTYDAQKVYRELERYATESIQEMFDATHK